MITAEIKIHEEPAPQVYTQHYTSYPAYTTMVGEQKANYENKHQLTLAEAKATVKVGDKVKIKSTQAIVEISSFVEHPKDVTIYCGEMCTIYAKHENSKASMEMRYSLAEFDMNTLNNLYPPLPGANDDISC